MSKKQNSKRGSSRPIQPKKAPAAQGSPTELQRCQQELEVARQEIKGLQAQAEDIARREVAVKDGERRLAGLKEQEAEVSAMQSATATRADELEKRERELANREGKLAERERDVSEREIEADAGFERRNRESLKELKDEHAALREQLDEGRSDAFKKLDAELEARRADVDAELTRIRKQAQARLDVELDGRREHFDAEIAQELENIDQRKNSLTETEKQQAERENQLIIRERKVVSDEAVIREDHANIQKTIDQRIGERESEFERQLALKDQRIERLAAQRDHFEKKVNESEDWRRRFGHKEPEEWIEDLHKLEADRDRLREELSKRPSLEDGDRLANLEEERRQWEQRRTEMNRELGELKAREGDWLIAVDERERLKDQKAVAERRVETLQAEQEKLRKDVGRLRSLYEQPKEREARVGNIEEPWFEELPGFAPEVSEKDWLDKIFQLCEDSEFSFPRRLLYAFHTSLKAAEWTPLTVLGGVSGTGKSKLPELYARFGGLMFESFPVQPDWDSPQSLFGFFNSVDNRFNAKPLLQALVQSQKEPKSEDYSGGMKDRLLLVLLDEMNLSHVELYFSDLLSKLEFRRGAKEEKKIPLNLGADKYLVSLGRNVLWVGTMNEDETTKTLSDKVLDRANLIGFPRPRELRRRQEATLADPQPMLARKTWDQWLCHRSDLKGEEIGKYKKVVEEISRYLEQDGRAIGHRVWQAIESYMANYPGVRGDSSTDDEARDKALRSAFEDALVHKVMPKLRGIEISGNPRSQCLDPILEVVSDSDLGLQLADDFELACSVGYAFVWRSAKYLEANQ